ncbi:tetratricopeptide repeat protein [Streptomyces sp. CA-294286]|uniref:tetratricopeptide repeat protein n=1 Tax=Streptomyces sp. CA-294286 TaxID=3240070 RepID=UPI003D8C973B
MTRCAHRLRTGARCPGDVLATGYCDHCGLAADERRFGPLTAKDRPARFLELPRQRPSSAGERLRRPGDPLRAVMRCSSLECRTVIGPPLTEGPVPLDGYCPVCGQRYSYRPDLDSSKDEADWLAGQYEVLGPIAQGGQGWVYLAVDHHLDEHVAVKGLLNRYLEGGPAQADEERRRLTAIRHHRIVRIRDFVRKLDADAHTVSGAYIVMDDVGDRTLEAMIDATRRGDFVLDIEHVLTYGWQILEALQALHASGLAYMDMKPSNVVHHQDGVKVIDLGALRELGRPHRRPDDILTTSRYASPEINRTRVPSVAHDLHTVGATLRELAEWAVDDEPRGRGVGAASFRAALDRATARDPERRFRTARDMADQLRGVLREIRALRPGEQDPPEPSPCFTPATRLPGARLGAVPEPAHWLRRPLHGRGRAPRSPVLDTAAPTPAEVAAGLPAPRPYEDDPQAARFQVSSGYDPAQYLAQAPGRRPSVEICLHNVRVSVALGTPRALVDARAQLAEARRIRAPRDAHGWRLEWHRALVALAGADEDAEGGAAGEGLRTARLREARGRFTVVFRALPGEYAAKLALAHCAELLDEEGLDGYAAAPLYRAVHARNPSHGGAALGLARRALAAGDRAGALDVLAAVPDSSRDRAVARIAALRIRAARLGPDGARAAESAVNEALFDLAQAEQDPAMRLSGDDVLRLRTELLERRLDAVLGTAGERAVREGLEENYRRLAHQRQDRAEYEHLIDLSHEIRPRTRF